MAPFADMTQAWPSPLTFCSCAVVDGAVYRLLSLWESFSGPVGVGLAPDIAGLVEPSSRIRLLAGHSSMSDVTFEDLVGQSLTKHPGTVDGWGAR